MSARCEMAACECRELHLRLSLCCAGTVECVNQVLAGATRASGHRQFPFFVRNQAQLAALEAASNSVHDKALRSMLPQGIAWHNAAMEPEDRATVEQLFLTRNVMFLAATATLAQACFCQMLLRSCKFTTNAYDMPGLECACLLHFTLHHP